MKKVLSPSLFFLLVFFIINSVYSQTSIHDDLTNFLKGDKSVFLTSGNPKAYGINIRIEIPANWKQKEGIRPHVIQKFSTAGENGRIKVALISIEPLPQILQPLTDKEIAQSMFDTEAINNNLPEDATLIAQKQTYYDGELGLLLTYYQLISNAGFDFFVTTVSHKFIYKHKIVDVVITYSVLLTNPSEIHYKQEESDLFLLLALQIGNSIVIMDKWL